MKDCYYDLGLHFILLDDSSQSYILKLRDRRANIGWVSSDYEEGLGEGMLDRGGNWRIRAKLEGGRGDGFRATT